MIIYPIAFLYVTIHLSLFYMAWYRPVAFEGFLLRLDESLSRRDYGWSLLILALVGSSTIGFIYSWYQH